jgi:hypothetical protein
MSEIIFIQYTRILKSQLESIRGYKSLNASQGIRFIWYNLHKL